MIENNKLFRHRYGGLYRTLGKIRYTDRDGEGVLYQHLFPFEFNTWVRPLEEFMDEGRFVPITTEEYGQAITSMPREDYQEMVKKNKAASK